MILKLVLNGLFNSLCKQKWQDLKYDIRDMLLQPEQIVEVNGAVLNVESLSDFFDELYGEADVVKVVEEGSDHDPKEVDQNVIQTRSIVLDEVLKLVLFASLFLCNTIEFTLVNRLNAFIEDSRDVFQELERELAIIVVADFI